MTVTSAIVKSVELSPSVKVMSAVCPAFRLIRSLVIASRGASVSTRRSFCRESEPLPPGAGKASSAARSERLPIVPPLRLRAVVAA